MLHQCSVMLVSFRVYHFEWNFSDSPEAIRVAMATNAAIPGSLLIITTRLFIILTANGDLSSDFKVRDPDVES